MKKLQIKHFETRQIITEFVETITVPDDYLSDPTTVEDIIAEALDEQAQYLDGVIVDGDLYDSGIDEWEEVK